MTDDEGFSAPSRSDEAPHGDQQQPLEDVENEALDAGEGELAQADDPSSRKLLLTGSPEHVARLFYLFSSAGKAATQERGRVYQHAFQVADDDIRRIDRRVRELLKIPATLDGNIDFSGTVRFPDLSTQRFSDLDDLLERAGEQKDPETLLLYWRAILAEPFGHVADIEVRFTTEAPLESEYKGIFDTYQASMNLDINGPTMEWADTTFMRLDPIMSSLKIGGVYRPLNIFANDTFISLISWPVAVLLQIITLTILSNVTNTNSGASELKAILRLPTLQQQFDAFLKQYLTGSSPISGQIISFIGSLVALLIGYVACRFLLPKLAPRSGIEIGLAKRRIQRYRNVFNFIVFSVLLFGIILPLIVGFILK